MSDTVSLVRSRTNSLHRVSSTSRSEAIPRNGIGPSRRLVESPKCHAQTSSALPAPLGLRLINATVKSVVSVGEGDRVAVDLCNLLNPGEALLVSWNELILFSTLQHRLSVARGYAWFAQNILSSGTMLHFFLSNGMFYVISGWFFLEGHVPGAF